MYLIKIMVYILLIIISSENILHAANYHNTMNIKNQLSHKNNAILVINEKTGKILFQENAGKKRFPASLTKVMTLYLTFEALSKNKLTPYQELAISSHASLQPRSNINLVAGETITVSDAILSLIVKSANDSAVVLAEAIAGSEPNFVKMMNSKAKQLNMNHTKFANASGLHNNNQYTTAYDMARLTIAIKKDFPKLFHLFSRNNFKYKNNLYKSHNRVLSNYAASNGLKTGYTRQAGFNIIVTATKRKNNLITIVMGGNTSAERDKKAINITDKMFASLASPHHLDSNSVVVSNDGYKHNNNNYIPVPQLNHITIQDMGKAILQKTLPT